MVQGFGIDWIISLLTLTGLEIVLGIDNIILIAILTERLPVELRSKGRRWGLGFALVTRLLLLSTLSWLTHMTTPMVEFLSHAFSVRDLVLLVGGFFLILKAGSEVYKFVELRDQNEPDENHPNAPQKMSYSTMRSIVLQIALFDIIFSLDSVLTAVGIAQHLAVMVTAVILSVGFMMFFANAISDFVSRNPSIKILAMAFLVMIGILLISESFGTHIEKSLVYFAMAFALFIELLNMRREKNVLKNN